MSLPLTDAECVAYLESINEDGEDTMRGNVRVKGNCSECDGKFSFVNKKLGFICKVCKTTPKRFFVDLFYQGQRIKIYSDKQGQALDSYKRAITLLTNINGEIKTHDFDPAKYLKAEQERFWVKNLLQRFLEDKLPSISPSRISHYTRYTELAKEFYGTKDVREIRKIDITDFKKNLIKKHYTEQPKQGKSLKNVMDHFKTFMIYCMKEYEIIDKVPTFPVIEMQPYQFKWLGQEDQANLYNMTEDKHKPFVAFLMLHGCRPGEARALKVKDVDLRQQVITISATFSDEVYKERRKGRGAKPVMVPIHPEMLDYITDRIKNNLPEAFIFTNRNGMPYTRSDVKHVWEKMKEKANIGEGLRFYDVTRHSFASQLVNSNTSIYKVSRLMGHSSTKMTEKYAHHDIEKLKADVQKLSLKHIATVPRVSPKAKEA